MRQVRPPFICALIEREPHGDPPIGSHVYTAIDMIRFLLRQYSTACADSFTVIRRQLHGLSTRQSGVGTAARELFKQIPSAH
jgi:hypothetical protein